VISALVSLVLSQALTPSVLPKPVEFAGAWPIVVPWKDGGGERLVHLDESLVAERDGDEHTGAALRSAGAMVSLKKGRMRLWRVERASVVLEVEPRLLPVYRDENSMTMRVPIGGVFVTPVKGVAPAKVRAEVGGTVEKGMVRVPCVPSKVFELVRTLSSVPGVLRVQPHWWLSTQRK
jgi:hypothetical protein